MNDVPKSHFSSLILTPLYQFQVLYNGSSDVGSEHAGLFIAYPTMHTSSSTVNPKNILESEILFEMDQLQISCHLQHLTPQSLMNDLDGNCHKLPALAAYVATPNQ
jgi:hypothetical protein